MSFFLFRAINQGNLEAVEDFLSTNEVDIDKIYDVNFYTPLVAAVVLNQKEIVKNLLEKGANANQQDPLGRLPLEVSISSYIGDSVHIFVKDYELVRLLLDYGAKPCSMKLYPLGNIADSFKPSVFVKLNRMISDRDNGYATYPSFNLKDLPMESALDQVLEDKTGVNKKIIKMFIMYEPYILYSKKVRDVLPRIKNYLIEDFQKDIQNGYENEKLEYGPRWCLQVLYNQTKQYYIKIIKKIIIKSGYKDLESIPDNIKNTVQTSEELKDMLQKLKAPPQESQKNADISAERRKAYLNEISQNFTKFQDLNTDERKKLVHQLTVDLDCTDDHLDALEQIFEPVAEKLQQDLDNIQNILTSFNKSVARQIGSSLHMNEKENDTYIPGAPKPNEALVLAKLTIAEFLDIKSVGRIKQVSNPLPSRKGMQEGQDDVMKPSSDVDDVALPIENLTIEVGGESSLREEST